MAAQDAAPKQSKWEKCDESKVDSVVDRARQGIHCTLFCGGVKCKHEDYTKHLHHQNVHPAIDGLNSHFVGDVVVASQRPSTSLFIKHMLVEQFRAKAISGVFNLQEKGEHSSCGPDGIYPETGYSYSGENDLMRFGLSYYEFPWPDMTAPETDIVLRSVQCMDLHIRTRGRVLVHCHAGLGRTGLMIASYFILAQRLQAQEAIALVRTCRPGAIQTARQVEFCVRFQQFVRKLAHTFKEMPGSGLIEFSDFLQRQFQLLHGHDARALRYVPRHVYYMLKRIITVLEGSTPRARAMALAAFAPSVCPDLGHATLCELHMNEGSFDASKIDDIPLLCYLTLDWFRRLDEPFFNESEAQVLCESARSWHGVNGASPVSLSADLLPRAKRHTTGILLSAFHKISGELPPAHLERAVVYLGDALTQQFSAAPEDQKMNLSPIDRQLLHRALALWALDVGDAYFDAAVAPAKRRVVKMIADFGAVK